VNEYPDLAPCTTSFSITMCFGVVSGGMLELPILMTPRPSEA
jgi:hypothetical protein